MTQWEKTVLFCSHIFKQISDTCENSGKSHVKMAR